MWSEHTKNTNNVKRNKESKHTNNIIYHTYMYVYYTLIGGEGSYLAKKRAGMRVVIFCGSI